MQSVDSVAAAEADQVDLGRHLACYGYSMLELGTVSRRQLHATFQEAFADYSVDMTSLSEDRLRVRFTKNAVDWEVSVGAFDGDRMVGFTMIGIDRWQGSLRAFDAATGIVPEFRGQGLAQKMFDHALQGLKGRGVESFALEVISDNEPAIRAYQKAGFAIARRLACFRLDLAEIRGEMELSEFDSIRPIDRNLACTLASEVDWPPSWENSFGAIGRIPDELVAVGAFDGDRCIGAAVYTPAMNWIMTLVVRRSYRRRGVGSAIVRALARAIPETVPSVKLLNVDDSDTGMTAFLERLGFWHLIDQYEMVRRI